MKGLKIPVGVGSNGGAAIVNGDENDTKIIVIALGSGESENAFQQDSTLGEDMIFDNNDPTNRARVLMRLYRIFDEFVSKKRFSLKKNTVKWIEGNGDSGELFLEFRYVNLESDEEKLFRQPFTVS